jgi:alkanesulfonate monooxygenase SsuD/methylene tetrahydromethanopterin reductase-like flavin-dependent oxidoreductase (luciferase family)
MAGMGQAEVSSRLVCSQTRIGHMAGRVGFGIVLPSREAAIAGDPSAKRLVDLAVRAEHLGFDSAWTGDAPFSRPRFDPLTLLAAVAARTERHG